MNPTPITSASQALSQAIQVLERQRSAEAKQCARNLRSLAGLPDEALPGTNPPRVAAPVVMRMQSPDGEKFHAELPVDIATFQTTPPNGQENGFAALLSTDSEAQAGAVTGQLNVTRPSLQMPTVFPDQSGRILLLHGPDGQHAAIPLRGGAAYGWLQSPEPTEVDGQIVVNFSARCLQHDTTSRHMTSLTVEGDEIFPARVRFTPQPDGLFVTVFPDPASGRPMWQTRCTVLALANFDPAIRGGLGAALRLMAPAGEFSAAHYRRALLMAGIHNASRTNRA